MTEGEGNQKETGESQPRYQKVWPFGPFAPFVLCYLAGIFFPIIYLTSEPTKRDRLIRFHAFQSIMFVSLWILVRLVSFASPAARSIAGWIEIGFLATWLLLIVAAYRGKKIKLPLIGKLAEQMAG